MNSLADIVKRPDKAIYLPPFFFSEIGVVKRMSAILQNREGIQVNPDGLAERISRKTGMRYDFLGVNITELKIRTVLSG